MHYQAVGYWRKQSWVKVKKYKGAAWMSLESSMEIWLLYPQLLLIVTGPPNQNSHIYIGWWSNYKQYGWLSGFHYENCYLEFQHCHTLSREAWSFGHGTVNIPSDKNNCKLFSVNWYQRFLFSEIKNPDHEAVHSSPSNSEVDKLYIHSAIHRYCLVLKHRNKFCRHVGKPWLKGPQVTPCLLFRGMVCQCTLFLLQHHMFWRACYLKWDYCNLFTCWIILFKQKS